MHVRSLTTAGLAAAALATGPAQAVPILGPTGTFYEFVATPTEWPDVLAAAASRSYLGTPGHLVTITSSAENAFVQSLNQGTETWLAASDAETEGTWKWVDGPEADQVFWKDGVTLTYAAWAPGEPNDFDFGEDAVWMYADGEWNDIHGAPRTTPDGERIAMLAKPTVAIAGVVLGRAALGAAHRATSRACAGFVQRRVAPSRRTGWSDGHAHCSSSVREVPHRARSA